LSKQNRQLHVRSVPHRSNSQTSNIEKNIIY
jgi:hypothetical protein